jgi:hypothetical protein
VTLDAKDSQKEKKETWRRAHALGRSGLNSLLRRRDARHQGGADDGRDNSGHAANRYGAGPRDHTGRGIWVLSVSKNPSPTPSSVSD